MKFDCVDKKQFKYDPYHANYSTIEAESINKAKYEYSKSFRETKYIDVLCQKSINGSFNF